MTCKQIRERVCVGNRYGNLTICERISINWKLGRNEWISWKLITLIQISGSEIIAKALDD